MGGQIELNKSSAFMQLAKKLRINPGGFVKETMYKDLCINK